MTDRRDGQDSITQVTRPRRAVRFPSPEEATGSSNSIFFLLLLSSLPPVSNFGERQRKERERKTHWQRLFDTWHMRGGPAVRLSVGPSVPVDHNGRSVWWGTGCHQFYWRGPFAFFIRRLSLVTHITITISLSLYIKWAIAIYSNWSDPVHDSRFLIYSNEVSFFRTDSMAITLYRYETLCVSFYRFTIKMWTTIPAFAPTIQKGSNQFQIIDFHSKTFIHNFFLVNSIFCC